MTLKWQGCVSTVKIFEGKSDALDVTVNLASIMVGSGQ